MQGPLDEDAISRLIDKKIMQHEIKIAMLSGALGAALLVGMFHAIALNHSLALA